MNNINWSDPNFNITPHFTVGEAITLHNWNRLATKDDGFVPIDIIQTCEMMEKIRDFLGCAINVHCMYRSSAYNLEIGSLEHDVHSLSMACDWDASPTLSIEETKEKLIPKLEEFDIRMEKGTTTWIHTDWRMAGPSGRYFTP